MTCQQSIFELRHDSVLVAEHAFEERFTSCDPSNGVAANLFFHR